MDPSENPDKNGGMNSTGIDKAGLFPLVFLIEFIILFGWIDDGTYIPTVNLFIFPGLFIGVCVWDWIIKLIENKNE